MSRMISCGNTEPSTNAVDVVLLAFIEVASMSTSVSSYPEDDLALQGIWKRVLRLRRRRFVLDLNSEFEVVERWKKLRFGSEVIGNLRAWVDGVPGRRKVDRWPGKKAVGGWLVSGKQLAGCRQTGPFIRKWNTEQTSFAQPKLSHVLVLYLGLTSVRKGSTIRRNVW